MADRPLSRDEQCRQLESMRASALRLSRSGDALLCGQIAQILGTIEALMTIIGAHSPMHAAEVPPDTRRRIRRQTKGAVPQ